MIANQSLNGVRITKEFFGMVLLLVVNWDKLTIRQDVDRELYESYFKPATVNLNISHR